MEPERVDVVVLGAGMAGMSAATAAAERGARVLLVERAPTIGGSAALSGGYVSAAAKTTPTGDTRPTCSLTASSRSHRSTSSSSRCSRAPRASCSTPPAAASPTRRPATTTTRWRWRRREAGRCGWALRSSGHGPPSGRRCRSAERRAHAGGVTGARRRTVPVPSATPARIRTMPTTAEAVSGSSSRPTPRISAVTGTR